MEKSLATWTTGLKRWKAYCCLSKDLRFWYVCFYVELQEFVHVALKKRSSLTLDNVKYTSCHSWSLQLEEKTVLICGSMIGSNNLGGLWTISGQWRPETECHIHEDRMYRRRLENLHAVVLVFGFWPVWTMCEFWTFVYWTLGHWEMLNTVHNFKLRPFKIAYFQIPSLRGWGWALMIPKTSPPDTKSPTMPWGRDACMKPKQ